MSNLFFSKSSVSRVANVATNQIARFEVWDSVVFVVFVKGQKLRPRFLSKKAFYADFVTSRQLAARQIKITKQLFSETKYTARNTVSDRTYELVLENDRAICECRDYRDQIEFVGRGVCKHGYALLNFLGCKTMAEYIEKQQPKPSPITITPPGLQSRPRPTIVNRRSID
jgi:hypothetical protein